MAYDRLLRGDAGDLIETPQGKGRVPLSKGDVGLQSSFEVTKCHLGH